MENSGNKEIVFIQGIAFSDDEPIFQRTADQQLGLILVAQSLTLVVFCLIFLVVSVAKISAPFKSYMVEPVSLKDIFMKMGGVGKEKGTNLINSFYISVISLSIVSLFLILLGLFSLLSERFPVIYIVELILVPVCYVYVAAMCILSLAASLFQIESNGILARAFAKAWELVQGNRLWAYTIILLLAVTIFVTFILVASKLGKVGHAVLAITIPSFWLIFLLKQLRGMLLHIRSLSKDRNENLIEETSGLPWFDYLFGDEIFADFNVLRSKVKKPSSHDSLV